MFAVCARCWRTGASRMRREWSSSTTSSRRPVSWLRTLTASPTRSVFLHAHVWDLRFGCLSLKVSRKLAFVEDELEVAEDRVKGGDR